ncbi:glycosyltransferase family 2 protein [Enterococcus durans]|uniref:glycosyltransferase family 2 protein n=1 Tax=Enterococcus durans TaxID=53345 RepID=UPI00321A2772
MCKISIIVPVYNVEQYLEKCINSILAQTFRDIEILLVDDGSTDNSGEICDNYAKIDPRVKVIHKENGGLSDARNAGIKLAKGEYIGFIDSDDYIDEDMYEFLYTNIKKYNADLATCGIYDVHKDKEIKKLPYFAKLIDREEAIELVLDAKIIVANAVNKLYKKDLFNEVLYPKDTIAEDAAVILQIINQCNRIYADTTQKYYYYHRANSITSRKFTKKDLDIIDVWKANEKWIIDYYPSLYEKAHTRVCWSYFVILDKLVLIKEKEFDKEKKEIRKYLMKNIMFILKNKRLTMQRKLSTLLLIFGTNVYKLPVKYKYEKIKTIN